MKPTTHHLRRSKLNSSPPIKAPTPTRPKTSPLLPSQSFRRYSLNEDLLVHALQSKSLDEKTLAKTMEGEYGNSHEFEVTYTSFLNKRSVSKCNGGTIQFLKIHLAKPESELSFSVKPKPKDAFLD